MADNPRTAREKLKAAIRAEILDALRIAITSRLRSEASSENNITVDWPTITAFTVDKLVRSLRVDPMRPVAMMKVRRYLYIKPREFHPDVIDSYRNIRTEHFMFPDGTGTIEMRAIVHDFRLELIRLAINIRLHNAVPLSDTTQAAYDPFEYVPSADAWTA